MSVSHTSYHENPLFELVLHKYADGPFYSLLSPVKGLEEPRCDGVGLRRGGGGERKGGY